MAPEAVVASKKQRLPKFPRVGIGERKLEPTIWNNPLQIRSIGDGLLSAIHLLAIVLAVDGLHLHLPGAVFTGLNRWLPSCRVVGQLVAGHFAFIAATATAPPIGIAGFGPLIRRANHSESAVDLADSVPRFRWHDCRGLNGRQRSSGILIAEFGKLGGHGGIAAGEFFHRHVLRLVICQTQVAVGSQECVFGLLKMID